MQAYPVILGANTWEVKIRRKNSEMPFIKHKGETRSNRNNNLSFPHHHLDIFSPADFDWKHVTVIYELSLYFAILWLKMNPASFRMNLFCLANSKSDQSILWSVKNYIQDMLSRICLIFLPDIKEGSARPISKNFLSVLTEKRVWWVLTFHLSGFFICFFVLFCFVSYLYSKTIKTLTMGRKFWNHMNS